MRVAIVTDANKGVGNGTVEPLARKNLPDNTEQKLGLEAVKALEEKGLIVRFHQIDITDADSQHKLAEFIKDKYPDGIDILVNNAGIAFKVGMHTVSHTDP
ncbi:unnamed protein product [Taenia asiatica]|uniref:Carbonyl reductase 1 n=1 Tax=Taenia asiatica TaxID=60517 RepID=A0A0R3WDC7_TAEAS|nr:unnamed protein product [Taenia asiatica]